MTLRELIRLLSDEGHYPDMNLPVVLSVKEYDAPAVAGALNGIRVVRKPHMTYLELGSA